MFSWIAQITVLLTGLFFIGLGLISFVAPHRARRFLMGFAGSAFAHYLELAIRIAVGLAFVVRSPFMLFTEAAALFGWVLVVTSLCLLAMPWRWHRRFAQQTVPHALRMLPWVGATSLAMGCLVVFAASA